jgi:hypothetical protein
MLSVDGVVHLSASDLVGHLNCHYLTKLDLAGALQSPQRSQLITDDRVDTRGALLDSTDMS